MRSEPSVLRRRGGVAFRRSPRSLPAAVSPSARALGWRSGRCRRPADRRGRRGGVAVRPIVGVVAAVSPSAGRPFASTSSRSRAGPLSRRRASPQAPSRGPPRERVRHRVKLAPTS